MSWEELAEQAAADIDKKNTENRKLRQALRDLLVALRTGTVNTASSVYRAAVDVLGDGE